jgi:hypothetical protein
VSSKQRYGPGADEDASLVKRACSSLMEHFDTVQIFCTRNQPDASDPNGGGTVNVQFGMGNWFARYGQVREFVIYEENCFNPGSPRYGSGEDDSQ